MGIKPTFDKNDIRKAMAEEKARVERVIIRNLQNVGENALTLARDSGDYTDRTGNLRSSVGYLVAKNGKVKEYGGFDANNNSGSDGEEGANEGESYAISMLQKFSKGYVLIVVAGMNYAEHVEKRQYDVLAFTEVESKALARELFESLSA